MINIQEINIDELDELDALYQELMGKKTNKEKMLKNYLLMKDNPDYILLGAKQEGDLAGSLQGIVCMQLVGECKSFMVIENVIVSNKHRKQGVGKKLMEEIEKLALNRGCSFVVLVSNIERKEAHKFYESIGYRIGEVQGFRKYLK